jgi:hypothetical protein
MWPFLSRSYSLGSLQVATLRGLRNGATTAPMLLAAMALPVQAVNIRLIYPYYRLGGREVGALLAPFYAYVDRVFVPAAVLAALR